MQRRDTRAVRAWPRQTRRSWRIRFRRQRSTSSRGSTRRFSSIKKGVERQIKAKGNRVNLSVKVAAILGDCVKVEANSDKWLECIPRYVDTQPTFKRAVDVTPTSARTCGIHSFSIGICTLKLMCM